jgi:predicted permease
MSLLQNVKYTFRQVRQNPGFFAIAMAALVLGIGANTAIFSAVDAVLLRPLPYGKPSRLAIVWEDASFIGFAHNTPAPANFVDWREQNQVFTDMAALRYQGSSLTGDQAPEEVMGGSVTPNLFDVLQVEPAMGRRWTAEEDAARSAVVVISYSLWQRRFGDDPAIVGRYVLMDGKDTKVIGVMARDFYFPTKDMEYWAPGYFTAEKLAERDSHYLTVVARLKQGATIEQAQQNMNVVAKGLEKQYPNSNTNLGAVVVPIQIEFAGDMRVGLWVLQIASLAVLLIACSNLANLLLARASAKEREIAVRLAMGASRMQVIRQLLTESVLLAGVGGALGLWLGDLCWRVLGKLMPEQMAGATFALNGKVLLFTTVISLATGILFGLVPALKATRVSLQEALKAGGRSGESRASMRLRDVLVAAQFALASALLVGAGLMIQTLWNLRQVDLGFRPDHMLVSILPLPQPKYDTDAKRRNFYRDVLDQLKVKPGVESAGFSSDAPFTSEGDTNGYLVQGEAPLQPGQVNDALYREVTPGYLETVGARVIDGRALQASDVETSEPVVVVSEFLAKRHWPGQSAVGKYMRVGGEKDPWRRVVGVVADVRERGLLLGMKPAVYLSTEQVKRPGADYLVVRTKQKPTQLVKTVESAVWTVDGEQPVARVRSMDDIIEQSVADRKRPMVLLEIFAGLALVIACVGIYGVLAYTVTLRTREIGVRMAVGATPANVMKMIVGRGLKMGLIGLGVGLVLAVALGRLLGTLLYGVKAVSPGVYAGTTVALVLAALLACWIPGRRAARVDPVVALREE